MSVEKTEVETFFGRCRCCLSYGYLKNMWSEHIYEGETEIYGEMLVQCFALTWDHLEASPEQDQICEQCISRLRDATDFKKVVLDSQYELLQQIDAENEAKVKVETLEDEEKFIIQYDRENEADTSDIKYDDTEYTAYTADTLESLKDETEYEEIEYLEEDDTGETNETIDIDSSQPIQQLKPINRRKRLNQPDTGDEPPKKRCPKKLPKSERYKTYKQYSEEDLRKCLEEVRNYQLTPAEASLKYNIPQKTICSKKNLDPKDVQTDNTTTSDYRMTLRAIRIATEGEVTTETKRYSEPLKETKAALDGHGGETKIKVIKPKSDDQSLMYKHQANLKVILQYSNATVIGSYGRYGYSCHFCATEAETPQTLKKHNLIAHPNGGDEAIKTKFVSKLIIKLDITHFKCKLCKKTMNSLEDFREHISYTHSKLIHNDITNYFIPFKFDTDSFRCFMCNKKFSHFKLLAEHMSEHYRNYECSVCDRSFINKHAMQVHTHRHTKGVFKCSQCPKEFETRPKRSDHERIMHTGKTQKCSYCQKLFPSWHSVLLHEIEMHGVKRPKYDCPECDKTFTTPGTMTAHRNRHHQRDMPYKCSVCGKAFTSKLGLDHHITMTKHKKIIVICEICGKFCDTQASLQQHMETHLDTENLQCDQCNRWFHEAAYENHMTKMHGKK